MVWSLPIISIFIFTFYFLVKNYGMKWIDSEATAEYAVANPHDMAFVAGRVSGKYILFEMVTKHPLIGIGLGNYPIMRNLDDYRSFFPIIDIYDATGLGGVQLTFIYPWFLVGINELYIRLKKKNKHEICIRLPLHW